MMKVNNRMRTYSPNRPKLSPVRGAVGGEGAFQSETSALHHQVSLDDDTVQMTDANSIDDPRSENGSEIIREGWANIRVSTSSSNNNSCSEELELISYKAEDEEAFFNSSDVIYPQNVSRQALRSDYFTVETMNIPAASQREKSDDDEGYVSILPNNRLSLRLRDHRDENHIGAKNIFERHVKENGSLSKRGILVAGDKNRRKQEDSVMSKPSASPESPDSLQILEIQRPLSPQRRVTFHTSTLHAPELRKLVTDRSIRIVRVRDAAVDTSDTDKDMSTVTQEDTNAPLRTVMARRMRLGDEGANDKDADDMSCAGEGERETWAGRLDFLVSTLGYAIGFGNVWRFPYLCYRSGGGAFFVPYFIFVILVGIPLVFLELSFGQYAGLGPISIWNVSPVFKGIGISMVVLSFVVSVYYNVILSWTFFYLFASMQSPLPWTSCNNTWNTPACCTTRFYMTGSCGHDVNVSASGPSGACYVVCGDEYVNASWTDAGSAASQGRLTDTQGMAYSQYITRHTLPFTVRTTIDPGEQLLNANNESELDDVLKTAVNTTGRLRSPAEEYFSFYMHGKPGFGDGLPAEGVAGLGGVRWHLALCLLLSTIIIFLCLVKGLRAFGRIAYITVLAPYVILLVLLMKTAMMEGADKGIAYYLSPQWHRLAEAQVWHDALNQVFFSLAPCYGGLITLSSYNRFQHNCYRDALLIPIGNGLTSIFAGFPIFCTLGYMASRLGTDIKNVVSSGAGLVFVVYPEALSELPGSAVWSLLFFVMLIALGIDSLLGYVTTIITSIIDEYPRVLYRGRLFVLVFACVALYVFGLPMITQGGLIVLEVLDRYATSYPPVILGILECVVLMWIYGYKNFSQDVWYMFGKKPGLWWRLLWQFVTPSLLMFLLLFRGVSQHLLPVEADTPTDSLAATGWSVAGVCILPVLTYALWAVVSTPGNIVKRWRRLIHPASDWGVFTEDDGHVPDYIRSDDEPSGEVMPSVGDIPDLPPPTEAGNDNEQSFDGCGDEDEVDSSSTEWSEDENKERGNWHGRYDFFLSALGYTMSLGNMWRFPYLVFKNGGGAFFLPYILMLVMCGLPLVILELFLGQFASVGSLSLWKLSPLFKGVGFTSCIISVLLAVYYSTIASWGLFYLCNCFTSDLPWTNCNNSWNTLACNSLSSLNHSKANQCFVNGTTATSLPGMCSNITNFSSYSNPAEEYFYRNVLRVSSGVDEVGHLQWRLSVSLLATSVITFLVLIKGVRSVGKVSYITPVLPSLTLLVLLVRFLTFGSGQLDGIRSLVTPEWSRLGDASVWADAASHLFFSLGLSMGGLSSLASYNRFHYDFYRDAYLICLIDTATSVIAGIVLFSILGVQAADTNVDLVDSIPSKFTLAFSLLPEVVGKLPLAPLWSFLLFLMFSCLAINAQFLLTTSLVISIMDEVPSFLAKRPILVRLFVCGAVYLLALPMTTQGGFYLMVILDHYVTLWAPLVVALLTCIVVFWVYGIAEVSTNQRAMLDSAPSLWWQTLWRFATPGTLLLLLVSVSVQYTQPSVDGLDSPDWAHGIGLVIGLGPLLAVPITALIQLCRTPGSGLMIVRRCMAASEGWGPALKQHRNNVYLPQLPALESTFSSNWMSMAKEMSIYATETSAVVAMAATYSEEARGKGADTKSQERMVTINSSSLCNDKNIQTDGGLIEHDSVVVVSPRKSPAQSFDASTQTLNEITLETETSTYYEDKNHTLSSKPLNVKSNAQEGSVYENQDNKAVRNDNIWKHFSKKWITNSMFDIRSVKPDPVRPIAILSKGALSSSAPSVNSLSSYSLAAISRPTNYPGLAESHRVGHGVSYSEIDLPRVNQMVEVNSSSSSSTGSHTTASNDSSLTASPRIRYDGACETSSMASVSKDLPYIDDSASDNSDGAYLETYL